MTSQTRLYACNSQDLNSNVNLTRGQWPSVILYRWLCGLFGCYMGHYIPRTTCTVRRQLMLYAPPNKFVQQVKFQCIHKLLSEKYRTNRCEFIFTSIRSAYRGSSVYEIHYISLKTIWSVADIVQSTCVHYVDWCVHRIACGRFSVIIWMSIATHRNCCFKVRTFPRCDLSSAIMLHNSWCVRSM